ncbi:hypothetical protein C8F04DRAFT_1188205 [Mycena alexandri]|uniref:Yeast cell wall synthesis Kre9/Knh1-like N-terminal domain-containing protein n=1 Tax=Mycena alexandri TaxID=1745969 RepID=A0AAD6SMC5_9AGAR|nr:hypothetical protein C8F04DRAFT_1188205 [Mycena alexandri]
MSPCVRLYATALAFVTAVAAVSNVQAPSSPAADSSVTITWSSDSSDTEPLTLAIVPTGDTPPFNGALAIANNVNAQANQATIVFPQMAPGSYVVSFISASNPSDVLASSPSFSIGAAPAAAAASSSAPSASATAPPASVSQSLASAKSSISSAASVAASSARSAASSALSSAASQASSALSSIASAASQSASQSASSAANPSQSGTTGGARALGIPTAGVTALVLGGLAVGAALGGFN